MRIVLSIDHETMVAIERNNWSNRVPLKSKSSLSAVTITLLTTTDRRCTLVSKSSRVYVRTKEKGSRNEKCRLIKEKPFNYSLNKRYQTPIYSYERHSLLLIKGKPNLWAI